MSQPVRRHHWIVRFTHWSSFLLVFAMIASGLQIYRAYARFGERDGPYFPNPFHDAAFPEWSRLGGWLAGGINWHLALMWPLAAVGLLYLGYLAITGEWRTLLFRPRDVGPALEMAKYYLRIRKDHPPQGKHNALQKMAYTGVLILGALSVLTGLVIWKPVQLWWLTALFGGFQATRYWHFGAVWLFVGFTIMHVILVFLADPASLRAMITGQYRGRYPVMIPDESSPPSGSNRRAFLASAAAAGAAACGWDGGSTLKPVLAGVSRFNDRVSELLFSPSRGAPKYDPTERSHTFPNYHISRMTPTLPDPEGWRLEVGGLVRTPLSLALEEVRALGRLTYTVKHHCVEGWSAVATWSGVPFRALAERAGMLPGARYVRFDSFDAGYFNGWDLKSAMHPETILAYGFNDRDLMPDHGAPLRLYAPHKLGYKLTKYLTRVTFAADRPGGYWEDQGYPWFAGV